MEVNELIEGQSVLVWLLLQANHITMAPRGQLIRLDLRLPLQLLQRVKSPPSERFSLEAPPVSSPLRSIKGCRLCGATGIKTNIVARQ